MTFPDLLKKCAATAYAEPRSPIHDQIGDLAVRWISGSLKPGAKILDLGCGSAFCSEKFKQLGFQPVAASVLKAEVTHARQLGLPAVELEMHSDRLRQTALDIFDAPFDLVWLRHVAEHSPCPMLLLVNCHEALAPGGLLYLEIPLPWTSSLHELNENHYSVLNVLAWESLIRRAGFEPLAQNQWPMITGQGPDCYHAFICKRK